MCSYGYIDETTAHNWLIYDPTNLNSLKSDLGFSEKAEWFHVVDKLIDMELFDVAEVVQEIHEPKDMSCLS